MHCQQIDWKLRAESQPNGAFCFLNDHISPHLIFCWRQQIQIGTNSLMQARKRCWITFTLLINPPLRNMESHSQSVETMAVVSLLCGVCCCFHTSVRDVESCSSNSSCETEFHMKRCAEEMSRASFASCQLVVSVMFYRAGLLSYQRSRCFQQKIQTDQHNRSCTKHERREI